MTRRVDDVVEVRGDGGSAEAREPFRPRQFLWRGRVYVVRDVLSHWYERSAWWEGAAVRVLRGETDGASTAGAAGGEREVWRVEASAGRSAGSGVYDLSVTVPAPDGRPSWRLLRVAD